MNPIAPEIFKAYDVRGIVDKTLTESAAEQIGRALGTLGARKNVKKFVVGRDGRLSGPRLAAALTRGLNAVGMDVVCLRRGTVARHDRRIRCAPTQVFDVDANGAAASQHANDESRAVRQIEMQVRIGPINFRASVLTLAPGPAGRIDTKCAADERAGHHPAESEHVTVPVVTEPIEARALVRRHPAERLCDTIAVGAERGGIRDECADFARGRP